jgi:NADH-quinone oxidoreductase subunit M
LVFVFWIGLSPEPFLAVMHASVSHLLAQVSGTVTAPITLVTVMLP